MSSTPNEFAIESWAAVATVTAAPNVPEAMPISRGHDNITRVRVRI
jgi:hypothetical protein